MTSKSMSEACPKKHVALVAGGWSTEREISLASAENVSKALTSAGYRVTFVDMDTDIAIQLSTLKPDVVFNCLHGALGEDGCLPGLLNIMKLPYTHSGVLASSLAFDKIKAKQWFRLTGVASAESVVVHKDDVIGGDPMDRPYVIKPRAQGNSLGVEVILEGADFDFSSYTFPHSDQILVERFIRGREFTVGVLNGKPIGVQEVYHSVSQQFQPNRVNYRPKFSKAPPLPIPDSWNAELLASAKKIYDSLDCRGPARLDLMVEEGTEKVIVLEINTNPGLREISLFPPLAANCQGMDMEHVVTEILKTARCDFY